MPTTAQTQLAIVRLAATLPVHRAFHWLHLHQPQLRLWLLEFLPIPAPPFQEQARALWFLQQFVNLGLTNPHIDAAGNALAELRHPDTPPDAPFTLVSAHLDTVFPQGTPPNPPRTAPASSPPGPATTVQASPPSSQSSPHSATPRSSPPPRSSSPPT